MSRITAGRVCSSSKQGICTINFIHSSPAFLPDLLFVQPVLLQERDHVFDETRLWDLAFGSSRLALIGRDARAATVGHHLGGIGRDFSQEFPRDAPLAGTADAAWVLAGNAVDHVELVGILRPQLLEFLEVNDVAARLVAKQQGVPERVAQEQIITQARIEYEQATRERETARDLAVEEAEIAAREQAEKLRIEQDRALNEERILSEQKTRELEIKQQQALQRAEITSSELIELARIAQERAVEVEQIGKDEVTRARDVTRELNIEAAEISKAEALEAAQIAKEKKIAKERIAFEQEVREREIARQEALDAAGVERQKALEQLDIARSRSVRQAKIESDEQIERARILSEIGLDDSRIEHRTTRRKLEISHEHQVEEAAMEKAIALFTKSLDDSAAAVKADLARAKAAEVAEKVQTARETQEVNRRRSIDVALAQKEAEEKRIAAEAERIRATVEAEARKLINEAENILTDEARHSLFRRKLLEYVEGIVAASVKPLERINDIKIVHLGGDGASGAGRGSSDTSSSGPTSPTDEVINSALRYRVQAPMVDSLLSDIGIDGSNISKQGLLREASDLSRVQAQLQRSRQMSEKTEQSEETSNDESSTSEGDE